MTRYNYCLIWHTLESYYRNILLTNKMSCTFFYLEVRSVIGVFVSRNKVSYRCSLPQHVSLCTNIVNVEIKTVSETSLACRCLIIKWLTCTRWHPTCHMSWQWPVTLSHSPWQSQYPYNIHAWLIPIKNILKHKCCWAVQNTFRQRSV